MQLNTAVFFDFENFVINCNIDNFIKKYQEQFVERIKNETSGGDFAFLKVYADWSAPRFKTFNSFLLEHGMEAVQVFGYSNTQESKNIADFMMSLDILETALLKPYIENFVICTGDAGFSVIINRLKALGKKTYVYRPERNYSRYLEKLADVCIGMEAEIEKRVNINVPASDKAVILSHPFTTADLPAADKLNVKIMQPEFLKNFESYGLTLYEADCTKQEVGDVIFGLLKILTLMNVYSQHPQILASISLLALLLEHYIEKFNAKTYGHKTLSKLINDLFTDTPYSLVRKNKESQYYIVVSEEGLKQLYSTVMVKPKRDDEKQAEEEKPAEKPVENSNSKNGGKNNDKHSVKQQGKHSGKQQIKQNDNKPNQPVKASPDKTEAAQAVSLPSDKPETEQAQTTEPQENETTVQQPELPAAVKSSAVKMNDYIRVSITLLLKKNLLNTEEFEHLLDDKFCKEKFGIAHPLLKEVSTPFFPGSELTVNGKKVYWKRVFKHDGRYFLIYGNWNNTQNKKFIAWADLNLK